MLSVIYILPIYIGIYSVAVATVLCSSVTGTLNVIAIKKITKLDLGFLKYGVIAMVFTAPCALLSEWICSCLKPYMGLYAMLPAGLIAVLSYCMLCFLTNVLDIRGIVFNRFKLAKKN